MTISFLCRFRWSRISISTAGLALFLCFTPAGLALDTAPSAPVFSGIGFSRDCSLLIRPPGPKARFGPYYRFPADFAVPGKIDLAKIGTTKFSSYNVLNLIERPGKYVNLKGKEVWQYGPLEKPPYQVEAVIRHILHEKPQFLVGVEIESLDAMLKLNASGLGNEYFMILIPGNDPRNINVGYFIHKSIGLDAEVQSYKHVTHFYEGRTVKLMSRDFPVITFRVPGASVNEDPLFVYAGLHLKSQRAEGLDAGSVQKRRAQVIGLLEILKRDYEDPYNGRVPVILSGDFNSDLNQSAELQPLKGKFVDTLDVAGVPVSDPSLRATHSFFPRDASGRGLPPVYSQLDGILVSKNSVEKGFVKDAHVLPDMNEDGSFRPLPRSLAERQANGSDHRMLSMTFDMQARYEEWLATRSRKR